MICVASTWERDRTRGMRVMYDGVPAPYPALPSALQACSRVGAALWAGQGRKLDKTGKLVHEITQSCVGPLSRRLP